MTGGRVLLVEDDKHIAKLVKYNLEKAGFICTVTITGEEAVEILDKQAVDLIILDVMLPKMDGFEFCKYLKQDKRFRRLPIMMLTARAEEIDRVLGFELGVDDYLVKPFSVRELLLRVKAILRRGVPSADVHPEVLQVGPLTIDVPRHKVTVAQKVLELSPMEFNLLKTLLERKGRVQSRDVLLNDVWGLSSEVTTRTVDTHIKLIRHKLGKAQRMIQTVRGMGYKISDDV